MPQQASQLLVLDLDETLIFATREAPHPGFNFKTLGYWVYLRPGLEQFLVEMNQHFQLAIWSSSTQEYLQPMVERIQPAGVPLAFVWGRERCSKVRDFARDDYVYEKRLSKLKPLGYALEKVIIVDNSPEKVAKNYGNAVYIPSFESQENDNYLPRLSRLLISYKEVPDIRKIEKRHWTSLY